MVVQAQAVTTAFVVAGGRSVRMGRDKALLPWNEAALLDHAIARLRRLSTDVRLLTGPEPRYLERGLPVIVDAIPDAGALAGVLAGLLASERPLALFLAVDLPFVTVELLAGLRERASEADAVIPVTAPGPEPLCAVYSRACAEPIRRRLERGERKMTCFWPDVRVREVGVDELSAHGDPAQLFRNLNTPEDYTAAAATCRAT